MRKPRTGSNGRGRSIGEAEHRMTGLARGSVLVVALAIALVCVPARANAQSTDERIQATRKAIDAAAQKWFEHQSESARLEAEIAQLEQRVADATERAARSEEIARARAVEIYMGARGDVVTVLDVAGDDALDSMRRAELLDRANAQSIEAIEEFQAATEDLEAQRAALEQRRAEQAQVGEQLRAQQAELETQLEALQRQAAAEAAARARAAAAAARAKASAPAPKAAPRAAAPAARTAPAPAPEQKAAPATGGTHPRHDDPFLVCTRARESNGNYAAVSRAGYYGAYQFAPTTWNATASRAGRLDLVGVLPSQASPYDQDELAWVLYQWQGKRPWNGRC